MCYTDGGLVPSHSYPLQRKCTAKDLITIFLSSEAGGRSRTPNAAAPVSGSQQVQTCEETNIRRTRVSEIHHSCIIYSYGI